MKDCFDLAKCAFGKQVVEVIRIDVVRNLQVGQVLELVAFSQVIDGNDVVDAAGVQALDDVAADKTCSAGHNYFHEDFPGVSWMQTARRS